MKQNRNLRMTMSVFAHEIMKSYIEKLALKGLPLHLIFSEIEEMEKFFEGQYYYQEGSVKSVTLSDECFNLYPLVGDLVQPLVEKKVEAVVIPYSIVYDPTARLIPFCELCQKAGIEVYKAPGVTAGGLRKGVFHCLCDRDFNLALDCLKLTPYLFSPQILGEFEGLASFVRFAQLSRKDKKKIGVTFTNGEDVVYDMQKPLSRILKKKLLRSVKEVSMYCLIEDDETFLRFIRDFSEFYRILEGG